MAKKNVLGMYKVTSNCNLRVNASGPCEMALVTDPGNCVKPAVLIQKLLGAKFETSKIISSIPTAVSLKSANVDKCDKTLSIVIAVQDDYETAKGLVKLSDVSFMINIGVQPFKFNFRISGTWSLGGINFDVTMLKTNKGDVIVGNLNASTISMSQIINSFGNNFVSRIEKIVSQIGLRKILVGKITLKSINDDVGFRIRQSFSAVYPALGNPTVYITVYKLRNGSNGVTLGCKFSNLKLSDLFKKLVKIDISAIPVIGQIKFNDLGMLFSTFSSEQSLMPYDDPNLKAPARNAVHDWYKIQSKRSPSKS